MRKLLGLALIGWPVVALAGYGLWSMGWHGLIFAGIVVAVASFAVGIVLYEESR